MPPFFIAVEYSEAIRKELTHWDNTPDVQIAWRRQFSAITDLEWQALTTSIAYEVAVSKEKFPNVEIVWLDDQREGLSADSYQDYAAKRMGIYLHWWNSLPSRNLLEMQTKSWRAAVGACASVTTNSSQRELQWKDQLSRRLDSSSPHWGIAILGETHIEEGQGRLVTALRNSGLAVQLHSIRPAT